MQEDHQPTSSCLQQSSAPNNNQNSTSAQDDPFDFELTSDIGLLSPDHEDLRSNPSLDNFLALAAELDQHGSGNCQPLPHQSSPLSIPFYPFEDTPRTSPNTTSAGTQEKSDRSHELSSCTFNIPHAPTHRTHILRNTSHMPNPSSEPPSMHTALEAVSASPKALVRYVWPSNTVVKQGTLGSNPQSGNPTQTLPPQAIAAPRDLSQPYNYYPSPSSLGPPNLHASLNSSASAQRPLHWQSYDTSAVSSPQCANGMAPSVQAHVHAPMSTSSSPAQPHHPSSHHLVPNQPPSHPHDSLYPGYPAYFPPSTSQAMTAYSAQYLQPARPTHSFSHPPSIPLTAAGTDPHNPAAHVASNSVPSYSCPYFSYPASANPPSSSHRAAFSAASVAHPTASAPPIVAQGPTFARPSHPSLPSASSLRTLAPQYLAYPPPPLLLPSTTSAGKDKPQHRWCPNRMRPRQTVYASRPDLSV